jgi:hypothetical protein
MLKFYMFVARALVSFEITTHQSMLITRTTAIITMTNNGMMRFVKSVSFGIAGSIRIKPAP